MELIAVFPEAPPPDLARTLDLSGYRWKAVASADDATKLKTLNNYLFVEQGYHGSRSDYYNRSNSYLNEVLDDREGLVQTGCCHHEPGHPLVQHRHPVSWTD